MIREVLTRMPDLSWTLISFGLFLGSFGFIAINTLRKGRRDFFDKISRAPLESDNARSTES